MKASDLSITEQSFLVDCNNNDQTQYINSSRVVMNTLAAYGLVEFIGTLRFRITEYGKEIVKELNFEYVNEETSERAYPGVLR